MYTWKVICFLFFATVFTVSLKGQASNEEISIAFSKGRANNLVEYLDNNISLKISSKEGYYSKNQAEEILQSFFKKVHPYNFNIIQKGFSGNATFYIGILRTEKKTYKILYYINSEKNNLIQEIQVIE
jgi:hypothetical protein